MSQPPTKFPYSALNKSTEETEKKAPTGSATPLSGIRDTAQPSPFSRPAATQEQRPISAVPPSTLPTSPLRPEALNQRPFTPATPAPLGQTAPGTRPLQASTAASGTFAAKTPGTGQAGSGQAGYGQAAGTQSTLGQTGAGRPYLGQTGQGQPNLGQSTWTSPLRQSTQAAPGTSALPPTAPPTGSLFNNRAARPGSGILPRHHVPHRRRRSVAVRRPAPSSSSSTWRVSVWRISVCSVSVWSGNSRTGKSAPAAFSFSQHTSRRSLAPTPVTGCGISRPRDCPCEHQSDLAFSQGPPDNR